MIGNPPFGCASAGWPEMSNADTATHATARDAGFVKRDVDVAERDAGIARPALLGLSRPNMSAILFSRLCGKPVRGSAPN